MMGKNESLWLDFVVYKGWEGNEGGRRSSSGIHSKEPLLASPKSVQVGKQGLRNERTVWVNWKKRERLSVMTCRIKLSVTRKSKQETADWVPLGHNTIVWVSKMIFEKRPPHANWLQSVPPIVEEREEYENRIETTSPRSPCKFYKWNVTKTFYYE